MSEEINTPQPAFPEPEIMSGDGYLKVTTTPGMTLRQWFAGQALLGLTQRYMFPDEIARKSLEIADQVILQLGNCSETPNCSGGAS